MIVTKVTQVTIIELNEANLLGKYRVYQGVSISELPCTMTIGIAYVQLNSQSWYNGHTIVT